MPSLYDPVDEKDVVATDEQGYPVATPPAGSFDFNLYNQQKGALSGDNRAADFAAYQQRNPDTETSQTLGKDFAWYPGDSPYPTREERDLEDASSAGDTKARQYLGMTRYRDAIAHGVNPVAALNANAPLLFGSSPVAGVKAIQSSIPKSGPTLKELRNTAGDLVASVVVDDQGRPRATIKPPSVKPEAINLADKEALSRLDSQIKKLNTESREIESGISHDKLYLRFHPEKAARLEKIPDEVKSAWDQRSSIVSKYSQPKGGGTPVAKPAMEGYKIGVKYNGLTYLGGDPNQEENWKR